MKVYAVNYSKYTGIWRYANLSAKNEMKETKFKVFANEKMAKIDKNIFFLFFYEMNRNK